MVLLSDGTERVGILGNDETVGGAWQALQIELLPTIRLVPSATAESGLQIAISLAENGQSLPHEILASSEMDELFQSSLAPLCTIFSPKLVYLNHDMESSPLDAIHTATSAFIDELDFAAFFAKSSSASRLLSDASTAGVSNEEFYHSLIPSEGSKRRKRNAPISSESPVIELHLLQANSVQDDDKSCISVRYDAIRPSEPSLDDSTHEDFEKNARAFHAFYPRISVITYLVKNDTSEESLNRSFIKHVEAIRLQLVTYELISRETKLPRGHIPQVEPFHYNLGKELITLWYELPNGSYDWQSRYASRIGFNGEVDSLAISHATTLPMASDSSKLSGKPAPRTAGRQNMFEAPSVSETRLADVHQRIPSPGDDYSVHLVKGSYEYYHYGQDGFDDNGWGCAYRSMQTLVSWILKQNISIRDVPSHAEIQRMLVDMMDKPPSFVNSKQWIGAVEISMCLSQHWDVVCKILHAQDGPRVCSYAEELQNHFDMLGSPVMIGGSTLAYTIIGVALNQETPTLPDGSPNMKFLILDPHYNGKESIDVVLNKGYCAWHPPTLFRKDAFYNLCLPQTPRWDLL